MWVPYILKIEIIDQSARNDAPQIRMQCMMMTFTTTTAQINKFENKKPEEMSSIARTRHIVS